MAQDEKIFAEGFSFKRNEKAPEFVVGRLSLKVEDAVAFMREHEKNGWVNVNIKTARSGNHYVELDTYEPQQGGSKPKEEEKPKSKPTQKDHIESFEAGDDLPF